MLPGATCQDPGQNKMAEIQPFYSEHRTEVTGRARCVESRIRPRRKLGKIINGSLGV